MALVLDTTLKGATANSYVSLAEAAAYFEPLLDFSPVWLALTEQQRIGWLIQGARVLDRLPFIGGKQTSGQALQFPRFTGFRRDHANNLYLEEIAIPAEVKNAQCEMVILLRREVNSLTGGTEREIESLSVPDVVSLTYAPGSGSSSAFGYGTKEGIAHILRDWLGNPNAFRITR